MMNDNTMVLIQKLGNRLVDTFHYIALFVIGATIVWSAAHDYIDMIRTGHANLEDILLLFIWNWVQWWVFILKPIVYLCSF